ncbi:unnamed protein product [Effrenium voratum]|nr:unnamed protein product [Effrenium voratum]
MLDLDMPLPEAAVRINDENYWKRRTQALKPSHTTSPFQKLVCPKADLAKPETYYSCGAYSKPINC